MTTRMFFFDLKKDAAVQETEMTFETGLNRETMRAALDEMEAARDEDGNVHLVFALDEMPEVTWGAMAEKMGQARELMKLKGRYAVVTDKGWMRKLFPVGQALTGIEGKVFALDELEQAKEWARAA